MAEDEEAQLLAAIAADPEDVQAREVYADWLDKRGDVRAEFLRLEAHLYAIPVRLAELSARLDPTWLRSVARRYDVVIVDAGPNKISAIKLVREITGQGHKDAKDLVEAIPLEPRRIATDLEPDAAEHVAKRFKQAGATTHVVPHGSPVFRVPDVGGIMVALASVIPQHKRVAINLVREVRARGLGDAFRLVERVLAGTPELLATNVTADYAGELIGMFAPVGTLTCAGVAGSTPAR